MTLQGENYKGRGGKEGEVASPGEADNFWYYFKMPIKFETAASVTKKTMTMRIVAVLMEDDDKDVGMDDVTWALLTFLKKKKKCEGEVSSADEPRQIE